MGAGATFYRAAIAYHLVPSAVAGTMLQFAVPGTPPPGTSGFINPSFAGFGIEVSSLVSFLGADQPNTLTYNLLNNLAGYTGKPPHIRLGSGVQDQTANPDEAQWPWLSSSPLNGQGAEGGSESLIDPLFFQVANQLPKDTPVTWGLDLAYQGEEEWTEHVTAVASEVHQNCPNLGLTSFEMGSGPGVYFQSVLQKEQADGQVRTRQWREQAGPDTAYGRILRLRNGTGAFFEPACTTQTTFEPNSRQARPSGHVASCQPRADGRDGDDGDSYYHFDLSSPSSSSSSALPAAGAAGAEKPLTPAHLLRLGATEDEFAAWTERVGRARAGGTTPAEKEKGSPSSPYVPRRLGVAGPVGLPGTIDTFAAALWTLNLLLYTAARGVDAVQFHLSAAAPGEEAPAAAADHASGGSLSSSSSSAATPWQWQEPGRGQGPSVRPAYYAFAAFDQLIGSGGGAQVVPITRLRVVREDGDEEDSDDVRDHLRAYAVYQDGAWASVVVLNTRPASAAAAAASTTSSSSVTVQVQLPPASPVGGSSSTRRVVAYLSYLTGAGADATSGTSWNGLSYEASGDGTPTAAQGVADDRGGDGAVRVVGDDGTLRFEVRDSQAVVANLGARLGDEVVAAAAAAAGGAAAEAGVEAGRSPIIGGGDGDGESPLAGTWGGTVTKPGDGEDEIEEDSVFCGVKQTTVTEGLVLVSFIVMMGVVVFIG